MTAPEGSLTSLDISLIMPQTTTLVRTVRKQLAVPMGHRPNPEVPECLVHGNLLRADRTGVQVHFHVDESLEGEKGPDHLLFVHLRYEARRRRDKEAVAHKKAGRTVEWLEAQLAKMVSGIDDLVLLIIEARLELKPFARKPPVAGVRLRIGSDRLSLCGAEYRAEAPGEAVVDRFRWSERRTGDLDIWLEYGYAWDGKPVDFWNAESERCLEYVQLALP